MNKGIEIAREMAEEDTKLLREVLHKEETEDICDNTTVAKLRDIEYKIHNLGEELQSIKTAVDRTEALVVSISKRIG